MSDERLKALEARILELQERERLVTDLRKRVETLEEGWSMESGISEVQIRDQVKRELEGPDLTEEIIDRLVTLESAVVCHGARLDTLEDRVRSLEVYRDELLKDLQTRDGQRQEPEGRIAILEILPDEAPVVGRPFRTTRDLAEVLGQQGRGYPSGATVEVRREAHQHVRNLQEASAPLQELAELQELVPGKRKPLVELDEDDGPELWKALPQLFGPRERAHLVVPKPQVMSLVKPDPGLTAEDFVGFVSVEPFRAARGDSAEGELLLRGACLSQWTRTWERMIGDPRALVGLMGDSCAVAGQVLAYGDQPVIGPAGPFIQIVIVEVRRYGDKAH